MSEFRIAAAQVASVRGDVARNLRTHAEAIEAAARRGVSVLVFPELSLIGYEPDLAAELALEPSDDRLTPLATLALRHRMHVVVGAPLRNAREKPALGAKPTLGAIHFAADGSRRAYAKMHLGGDEPNWFVLGDAPHQFSVGGQSIGLAICADASQASHPQNYAERGATIYAAGVFLTAAWHATDAPRLAAHAARFGMLVVMANQGASVGTLTSVGRSAIWTPDGALLAEAPDTASALVVATNEAGRWRGEVVAP